MKLMNCSWIRPNCLGNLARSTKGLFGIIDSSFCNTAKKKKDILIKIFLGKFQWYPSFSQPYSKDLTSLAALSIILQHGQFWCSCVL